MPETCDLHRFVDAQRGVYDDVLAELRSGRKRTHWIWFVFPQLAGLGNSAMAQRYAISSRGEARAYLRHPVLGPRLRECARIVNGLERCTIEEIFGWPDKLKVRSSMTLFVECAETTTDREEFRALLTKYYGGEPDPATPDRLSG